jgi:hypothetical protein
MANEGWRATFYPAGKEHSANECRRLSVGTDTVARGAARGMGRVVRQGRDADIRANAS